MTSITRRELIACLIEWSRSACFREKAAMLSFLCFTKHKYYDTGENVIIYNKRRLPPIVLK